MKKLIYTLGFSSLILFAACGSKDQSADTTQDTSDSTEVVEKAPLREPLASNEKHLANIRQLTFGGNNAEAYFSYDDTRLIMQSDYTKWGVECDQIFLMNIDDAMRDTIQPPMVSTGLGRTTCSFFLPDGKRFIYSSTHLGDTVCPPVPEYVPGGPYLWPIYDSYDIFIADTSGEILKQLTNSPGYDAEPTLSPDGSKIVFTSTRSGDLELYIMDIDGNNVTQVTNGLGYDGGAFFSPDGKKLVFRASRPKTPEDIKTYKDYLAKGLVAPTNMEIYTCNLDGSELTQITNLGKANWAPYFHPSGEKIIFASNHEAERGFAFQLYMINIDGTGLEKITTESNFNAFPMFSYDGKKLVFSSNRNNGGTRETNVFIADWVD